MKKNVYKVISFGLGIIIISELIGTLTIQLSTGRISILPMIWATFLGMLLGTKKIHAIDEDGMKFASRFIFPGTLMLIAVLGFNIGKSIELLLDSGLILVLQEVGNLTTIIIGLPVAVFLGLKRQSVGATFSLPREGALAVVSEQYGLNSEEGKGVMGVFIVGTLLGGVFYSIFSGVCATYLNFHPYALAMASGMGSFSMMGGSTGTLTSMYPELADNILAYAGGSAVLTTLDGVLVNVFVALPLANKFYDFLNRKKMEKENIHEQASC
ncbi:MAG: DUF3100 domain-containing protein [Desulfosporosinus sp.]|nr:DUF3100 domain-containing protein [Desulfosporosinus sp.]